VSLQVEDLSRVEEEVVDEQGAIEVLVWDAQRTQDAANGTLPGVADFFAPVGDSPQTCP
jgi:hypothetical protein